MRKRKTNIVDYCIYVESRKIQMNLLAKQKYRHRHREKMYDHQGGGGKGGMNWKTGTDIYTLQKNRYSQNGLRA